MRSRTLSSCINVLLLLFSIIFIISPVESALPTPGNVGIGANADWFAGPNDYYNAAVYVDAMRQSRTFGYSGQMWNTTGLTYDQYGIPIGYQNFGAIIFGVTGPLNDFDGVWTWRITGANVSIDTNFLRTGCCTLVYNWQYNPTTQQTTASMNCSTNGNSQTLYANFQINSGKITNMELIRPGYPIDNYPMFTKAYLQMLTGFNTIRFMDWSAVNSEVNMVEWSGRNTLQAIQWSNGKGVPYEASIELCNTIGSNPWINIPLNASDDFMLKLAQLVKEKLNPNLIVYVEFSNEPWNFAFAVGGITVAKATALNATGNYNFLNFDRSDNIYYMAYRWYTWRAMVASNQFRKVFGDADMITRVRPVINSQYNGNQLDVGFSMINSVFGPVQNFFYAGAIAPYFGSDIGSTSPPDTLIGQIKKASDDVLIEVSRAMVVAKRYGVELVCYEGGPGDIASNIQYDTRLGKIILDYTHTMYSIGVNLFNYYMVGATVLMSYHWGTTDNMFNFTTPKFLTLQELKADNSPYDFPYIPYIEVINASYTIIPQRQKEGWPSSWDLSRWSTMQHNFGETEKNGAYYKMTFNYRCSAPLNMNLYLNNEFMTSFTLSNTSVATNLTFFTLRTAPRVNVLFFNITNFADTKGGDAYFLWMERNSTAPPAYEYPPLSFSDSPSPSSSTSATATTTTTASPDSSSTIMRVDWLLLLVIIVIVALAQ